MSTYERISFMLLSLICLAVIPVRYTTAQPIDTNRIEAIIQEHLKASGTPGIAIGIVRGDSLVYVRGFGVANVETGEPVTPVTLFRLGSATKIFTATMLLMLAEQGRLDLNAPIEQYMTGLSPGLSRVTAHQLLSYTAGIHWDSIWWGAHDDAALMATVRSWTDSVFVLPPGTGMSYSNPSYWLAGALIEAVTGKAFADQMQAELFTRLGMQRSAFRVVDAVTYPVSQGHQAQGNNPPTVVRPFVDAAVSYPSSQMFSNVEDLARFAIVLLNQGRIDGRQALPPNVVQRLLTPYTDVSTHREPVRMGYSIEHLMHRGVRMLRWGGAVAGYNFNYWIAPDQRVALIIQANTISGVTGFDNDRILELLLPLGSIQPLAPALPMGPAEMSEYTGRYINNAAFNIGVDLFVKDNRLTGRFHYAQGSEEWPLVKVGGGRFRRADPVPPIMPMPYIVVRTGSDGASKYLQWNYWTAKKVDAKP